jgi:hypothetical protein
VEVEFRDGKREVPDYLAELMHGIETHRLTYDEAVEQANEQLTRTHLNRVMDQTIGGHLGNWRRNT